MLHAQTFQLYGNLLTDEARQPWEKIVKMQTDTIPREDLRGEVHEEEAGKTWTSFLECVTFHLQFVFPTNAAEAVKFYIMNTLKKPNRVPIWQFFVRVEQLNSYLENLPSLFLSPKANSATNRLRRLRTLILQRTCCECALSSGRGSMTSWRTPLRSVRGPC